MTTRERASAFRPGSTPLASVRRFRGEGGRSLGESKTHIEDDAWLSHMFFVILHLTLFSRVYHLGPGRRVRTRESNSTHSRCDAGQVCGPTPVCMAAGCSPERNNTRNIRTWRREEGGEKRRGQTRRESTRESQKRTEGNPPSRTTLMSTEDGCAEVGQQV